MITLFVLDDLKDFARCASCGWGEVVASASLNAAMAGQSVK